ncbi:MULTISPECIES: type 4a pilus biogenesis protein PilO [Pseudoalteromonas]|uniref:Type 4a pilus biogenesis protein PilO n=1 Tax=Pseudoalteromonas maricaloris TaxID=184924 RepID=A0A8I2H6H5_9GAMM|nr:MULTISPECIES: type 4a pilus biogenesis protein PilO [Pseudoalteromonas]KID35986.1 pilus assembly protein PilP [Pseudoalteromonas flavipulchra NCIMB 2033 = ATCC BAA-314]KJY94421.1 pilus assembly protein PilP [Pseudoalteromonas piscicida]MBD0780154.1 type 4a pilus biogenesis protein PilO [Pseudoalteromonas flavipulchra]MBE0371396.1 type IV pilus assembly protein PilO [Pseudoalteromonas flavipulchra NCIMB 2033 = ATCC BAA-314]NLR23951.1 type 4a pilus biogenesis protein PilO [Pseudoalteromonas m
MNFDLNSLKEIDWNELELDNIGHWPFPVKVLCSILVVLLMMILGYNLMVSSSIDRYDQAVKKEQELRTSYRIKYARANNLELYKQQMIDMEAQFTELLRRLPSSNETPGLLDDLTYVGTSSGLTFLKIGWMPEVRKEFYTELPIKLEVIGKYHEFGQFVSKVSELPRIVSLHDFRIENAGNGELVFSVVAKTYRYEQGGQK